MAWVNGVHARMTSAHSTFKYGASDRKIGDLGTPAWSRPDTVVVLRDTKLKHGHLDWLSQAQVKPYEA